MLISLYLPLLFWLLMVCDVERIQAEEKISPSQVVIIVNDNKITYAQYKRAYAYHLKLYKEKYGKFLKEWERELKKVVIEGLILEALLLQEAKKTIKVSDEEVKQRIRELPTFKDAKGRFDEGKYRLALSNPNINWDKIYESQRNFLLRKKMEEKIKEEIRVSEEEIRREFCKDNEKIRVKYICIKFEEDKVSPGTVTDAEIKAYYITHIKEYQEPEQVRARHILIKPEPDEKEAKDKIEGILKEVKSGRNFEELAQRYSACPSKNQGGNLGFFTRGRMVKPFEETAFSLKPGEISNVVKTQFGFHIIKVEEKMEARTIPLEEVREGIRNIIYSQKIRKESERIAKAKADEIYNKIVATDIERVAKEYQLEVRDSGFIGYHQPIGDIGYCPEFENMFNLKQTEVCKPMKTWAGFLIAQLIERQIDEAKYLKEKEIIRQNIFHRKSQTALDDWYKKKKVAARIIINL